MRKRGNNKSKSKSTSKSRRGLASLPLPPASALSALEGASLEGGSDSRSSFSSWWIVGGVVAAGVGLAALMWWLSKPKEAQAPEGEQASA